MTFKALLAEKTGETISTSVVEMNEQDLMPGESPEPYRRRCQCITVANRHAGRRGRLAGLRR